MDQTNGGMNFHQNQSVSTLAKSKYSSFDQIIARIVQLSAFLMPIFFLPWTSDILNFQKQVLLVVLSSVALVIWLVGIIKEGKITKVATGLALPISLLILSALLSSLFSIEQFRSFFGVGGAVASSFTTLISLVVLFGLALVSTSDRGKRITQSLTLGAVIALLFGILQALNLHLIPFGALRLASFNTIGSLNALAIFGAIFLPILFMAPKNEETLGRWVRQIGIALIFITLVMANWFLIWAVALIGVIAFVAFQSFSGGFSPKKFILPMTVVVLGVFLVLTGLNVSFLRQNVPTEVGPAFGLSWQVLKDSISSHPVFGFGPENYLYAFERSGVEALSGTTFAGTRFNSATSEVMTHVVNFGVVGLIVLAFFLYSVVALIIRKLYQGQINPAIGGALVASLGAMFLYPFNLSLLFLFWLILALFILKAGDFRQEEIVLENSPRLSLVSSVAFIIGLIVVLTGGYYTTTRYIADSSYVSAATEQNIDQAVTKVGRAINLNPFDSRYYRLASEVFIQQIRNEIQTQNTTKEDRTAQIQALVQNVVRVNQQATDQNPHDSLNWYQRGLAHQSLIGVVGGVEGLAIDYFNEAIKRNSGNADIYNQLGEAHLFRSDQNRVLAQREKTQATAQELTRESNEDLLLAQESFMRATEISPNFGKAIFNLAGTYDRQNQVPQAIAQIEQLVPFNSNNAGLAFQLGLLYYRNDQKPQAKQQLERAVTLLPNYANALWYLSLVEEEAGDIPAAIKRLELILASNPENAEVQSRLEALRRGETTIRGDVLDQEPLELPDTSQIGA